MACLTGALLVVLGLAACTNPPPPPELPEITSDHRERFRLDVADVQVLDRYIPPLVAPHVEHLMPVPPYTAAVRWGERRFEAAGLTGELRIIITDAEVIEERMAQSQGLSGLFVREPSERYLARLDVEIRPISPGQPTDVITIRVERETSAMEDTTVAQREFMWVEMIEAMINDLDQAAISRLRQQKPELFIE